MIAFNDTFTDTDDTNLSAHTPDTGTGWSILIFTTDAGEELEITDINTFELCGDY